MDIQFSALPSMTTSFQAVGGIAKWRLAMKTWFVPGQSWHQIMKLQNLLCQGPPLRAEPQRRPSFLETKIGQNQKNKHTYWSHEYAKASPDRKYNDAIFSKLQVLFQLYHRNPKCQKICSHHTIPETMQHLKLKPKILEEWTYTNCGRMHGQMHQNNVVWLIGAVERFIQKNARKNKNWSPPPITQKNTWVASLGLKNPSPHSNVCHACIIKSFRQLIHMIVDSFRLIRKYKHIAAQNMFFSHFWCEDTDPLQRIHTFHTSDRDACLSQPSCSLLFSSVSS